jgi:hypothetical protein
MLSPDKVPLPAPDPVLDEWFDKTFATVRDAAEPDRPGIVLDAVAVIAPYTTGKPHLRAAAISALYDIGKQYGVTGRTFREACGRARSEAPPAPVADVAQAKMTFGERLLGFFRCATLH